MAARIAIGPLSWTLLVTSSLNSASMNSAQRRSPSGEPEMPMDSYGR
ncbi:hypothetical protein [Streptomyces sp. TE33382]